MRTLHKNSGQNRKYFSAFGLLFIFNVAEDPEKTFLLRRWVWKNERLAMETQPFFSMGTVRFYEDDGQVIKMFRVILGPFKLNIAKESQYR